MGIIMAIITVAVGSAVGMALLSKTDLIFQALGPLPTGTHAAGADTYTNSWSGNATASAVASAFNSTVGIAYSSWPMLGLVVLGLIGAAVISAIMIFR